MTSTPTRARCPQARHSQRQETGGCPSPACQLGGWGDARLTNANSTNFPRGFFAFVSDRRRFGLKLGGRQAGPRRMHIVSPQSQRETRLQSNAPSLNRHRALLHGVDPVNTLRGTWRASRHNHLGSKVSSANGASSRRPPCHQKQRRRKQQNAFKCVLLL